MSKFFLFATVCIQLMLFCNPAEAKQSSHRKGSISAEQAFEAAQHAKWKAEDEAVEREYKVRHRNNIDSELNRLGLNPSDFREQGSYVISKSIVCSEGHESKLKSQYADYSPLDCATGDGEPDFCYYSVLKLDCINRTK